MAKRKTVSAVVVCDSDDEEIHVPQARSLHVSRDGRRVVETPRSPQKQAAAPQPSPHYEWNPSVDYDHADGDGYVCIEESADEASTTIPHVIGKVASKRYPTSDEPLLEWSGKHGDGIGCRQEYLAEFLRLEGRGDAHQWAGCCMSCNSDDGTFRCEECIGGILECRVCCVARHEHLPLHIIARWTGDYFEKTSLKSMGLRVGLNHLGGKCVRPQPGHKDFIVLHTNGIHYVAVDFCGCERRIPNRQQLLRSQWFPATIHAPQTCASFRLLELFHIVTLTGKLSAHEFYRSLEHLTDNTDLNVPKTRYKSFMRIIREFRHLKLMKRAGRGNISGGLASTKAGDLCVECPACPIPGTNLPDDWENVAPEMKFLMTLIVAMDANFRLKNLIRSSLAKDPGLHTGFAYFPPDEPYRQHVLKYASQKDISNCSGFKTMAHADSKFSTGLRSTGVGMCICARHEIVRAGGVGDLQKGERYCNMDFILLSALAPCLLLNIFVSYNIACQFKLGFEKRMKDLPQELKLSSSVATDWGIPKCHCPAHKLPCQAPHSLNLKPGVGRTDGEGIERSWSEMNRVANSTKEMGPGSRHDTLDDHFGHHNWRKKVALGNTLHSRLRLATAESKRQRAAHEEFTASLPDAKFEREWTATITAWEKDASKPNPYVTLTTHDSQDNVKRALLEEEAEDLKNGIPQIHDTGPTAFMSMALLIEETQRRVDWDAQKPSLTGQQENLIQQRRLLLHRQLKHFRELQSSYIPSASLMIELEEESRRQIPEATRPRVEVERQKLWLPSDLPSNHREHGCHSKLAGIELKLRRAQCKDTLEKVRSLQRARLSMITFRNRNVRGQAPNTRSVDSIRRVEDKCLAAAVRYNAARAALVALQGPGDWEKELRELLRSDLTTPDGTELCIEDPHDNIGRNGKGKSKKQKKNDQLGLGEGKRKISWIWRVAGAMGDGGDDVLNDALRIEWAKSRARYLRWSEEVLLLKEEMRRVRKTLEKRVTWWQEREDPWEGLDRAEAEGVRAYAKRQAMMEQLLYERFTRLWDDPLSPLVNREDSGEGPGSGVDPVLEAMVEEEEDF